MTATDRNSPRHPAADRRSVSVLLTYRQAGEAIIAAVGSVLAQSHPRLELLLVDDNDDDRRQIEALRPRIDDDRARFLASPRQGRVHALQFAVANARHDICAIIDDDDLWHPDKLAWDLTVLDRARGVEFVCCPVKLFTNAVTFPTFETPPSLRALTIGEMLIRNRIVQPAVTCYRDLLRYDARLKTSEDYELWLRLQHEGITLHKLSQARVAQRVHRSNFLARGLVRFYWHSVLIQTRYVLKARRYHLLPFPLLRLLYTTVRRPILEYRARRGALTLERTPA